MGPSSQPVGAAAPLKIKSTGIDQKKFPDLKKVHSTVLSEGPRARKEITYLLVVDRNTGELHHDALTVKTYRLNKGRWNADRKHSISLTSESGDELQKLIGFIQAARSQAIPNKSGTFVVVEAPDVGIDPAVFQKALNNLSADGKGDVLANVLSQASKNPKLIGVLLERAAKDPLLFAEAAAALNLATYQRAVADLKALINTSEREQDFQSLLTAHPWMFGSEYSQLLDRRKWTRDENQDFVLRRTSDGYIELIEIKTPLNGRALFNHDQSHDSYYASAPLSVVVGQVQNYIEKLDRCRDSIKANDGEDTCKVRAKIIIGRNGNQKQLEALRRFNGHMHRIEVLTFDQLLRIAENVVSYLDNALAPSPQATTPAAPPVAAAPLRPPPTGPAVPSPGGLPPRSPPVRQSARQPSAAPAQPEPEFRDDDIPF